MPSACVCFIAPFHTPQHTQHTLGAYSKPKLQLQLHESESESELERLPAPNVWRRLISCGFYFHPFGWFVVWAPTKIKQTTKIQNNKYKIKTNTNTRRNPKKQPKKRAQSLARRQNIFGFAFLYIGLASLGSAWLGLTWL